MGTESDGLVRGHVRVIRSQVVCELALIDADSVLFVQDDTPVELELDRGRWEWMGSPTVVTITIEPGDLTEPAASAENAA